MKNIEEIKDALRAIVLDILEDEDIEEIKDDDHFIEDLEMDSLQAVSMLIHLEKRLKVSIPEEEIAKFVDINAVADLVVSYMNRSEPAASAAAG